MVQGETWLNLLASLRGTLGSTHMLHLRRLYLAMVGIWKAQGVGTF